MTCMKITADTLGLIRCIDIVTISDVDGKEIQFTVI